MDPQTAAFLLDLNRRFYTEHGESFAATRRRIQDGVQRVLDDLPDAPGERWLDLGCGAGALAAEWLRRGRQSAYLGLDFSDTLLAEAQAAVAGLPGAERVAFARADLSDPGWARDLAPGFRGVLAFAVLHHLPGRDLRERVLRQVRDLLAPEGLFVHSVWQFQHSPKLMARVIPWERVGLSEEQLEPGDSLLDWRAGPTGLRYVHLFSREELFELAAAAGFRVVQDFSADGVGGRLGYYQKWVKREG